MSPVPPTGTAPPAALPAPTTTAPGTGPAGTTITQALWKTGAVTSRPRAMLGPVETRSVSPVFVGRTDELATLDDALARAGAAEPQALLLGGEAGVGKTRLVEEFATAAAGQGAV
ncbi:ATP-binding protein, partial [Streptomyces rameus]|uniref:ATP-binding protein n=1 Tax=Streptomyces rameus TaxID=68261 RepID=UPI003CD09643